MLPQGYALALGAPSFADYQRLRAEAGLSSFPDAAARQGLPGTFLGVAVRHDGEVIGMGRVSGDGGLFFQLTDIAVTPPHQGKGLGKAIVAALLEALAARLVGRAYVSLIADGVASELYAQFGFAPVAPASQGMAMWLAPAVAG